MKIGNIKSLEKHSRILNDQIQSIKEDQNSPEETNILEELEAELNRISGHLNNLRVVKKSPPGIIINFIKNYLSEYLPELAPQVNCEILDEKRIVLKIKASYLGYNLDRDENYDPVNEQDSEKWERFGENTHRNKHPYRPILDRVNQLDNNFDLEINEHSYHDCLELCFEFTKNHAREEVVKLLWTDVIREVINICNLHRTGQGLPAI